MAPRAAKSTQAEVCTTSHIARALYLFIGLGWLYLDDGFSFSRIFVFVAPTRDRLAAV